MSQKVQVFDLRTGMSVLLATGRKVIKSLQYRQDNIHVKIVFTDGSSTVLRESDFIAMC
jgi:hypothetical protein